MITLSLIAQAAQDISSVPADFVKSFLIMMAFMAALGGGVMWGRRGSKGSPLHVEQPVSVDATVSHAPVYAHHSELEKLRQHIDAVARENLRQHQTAAGQLQDVITAGHDRQTTILSALGQMETRMSALLSKETKEITDRLNPLCEKVASHCALIKWIQTRLIEIWDGLTARIESVSKSQAEDTRRLHSRVDDAMSKKVKG